MSAQELTRGDPTGAPATTRMQMRGHAASYHSPPVPLVSLTTGSLCTHARH